MNCLFICMSYNSKILVTLLTIGTRIRLNINVTINDKHITKLISMLLPLVYYITNTKKFIENLFLLNYF